MTSLAAVIKHIKPTWGATEIKRHLIDPTYGYVWTHDAYNLDSQGYPLQLYPFINYPNSINGALLLATTGSPVQAIFEAILDRPFGDTLFSTSSPDLAAQVMANLCDEGVLVVTDNGGSFNYAPREEDYLFQGRYAWVEVYPSTFRVVVHMATDGDELILECPGCVFQPDTGYSVQVDSTGCHYVNSAADIGSCTGFSGEILLGDSEIYQYHNSANSPIAGAVEGTLRGTFTLQRESSTETVAAEIEEASFRVYTDYGGCDEACWSRLETVCSGGRDHTLNEP